MGCCELPTKSPPITVTALGVGGGSLLSSQNRSHPVTSRELGRQKCIRTPSRMLLQRHILVIVFIAPLSSATIKYRPEQQVYFHIDTPRLLFHSFVKSGRVTGSPSLSHTVPIRHALPKVSPGYGCECINNPKTYINKTMYCLGGTHLCQQLDR